ncbi:PhlD [Streptomyces sp. NPDC000983]|uniref:type III polyketide synthase n=1 Tax=Streptomyces sp. NPDC000983 TaxID=3154373 RepID=UPI00332E01E6
MPVVSAPVVALPRYQVTTDELIDQIRELYPEHPRLRAVVRAIRATTVQTRWYTRPPLERLREQRSLADHAREHLLDSVELAERAAEGALREAGVTPGDIDAVVVTSATGHTMPGLDVRLMQRLGVRPQARRIPVTQMGCAGGVFGISTAMELVAARPEATVLVVCADVFSAYLNCADTGMDGMIFKGLFGDAAGACVVRGRADGPHMELTASWECLHPGSADVVGTRTSGDGLHGYNSPELLNVIGSVLPHLGDWLRATALEGEDPAPEFVVSHTGGPKVIDALAEGLGGPAELFGMARDSLRDVGNVGSVSALEVLERTFAKPPADGARGLLLAPGPGIALMAVKAVWREGV